MTGQELYTRYTSRRDYSGSDADQYAQLLSTIFRNILDGIYPLLEKAEAEGKKLTLSDPAILQDEYTSADVILK
jgi:hypothetical protein